MQFKVAFEAEIKPCDLNNIDNIPYVIHVYRIYYYTICSKCINDFLSSFFLYIFVVVVLIQLEIGSR